MTQEVTAGRPSVRAANSFDLEIVRSLFREYAAAIGIDLSFQNFEEELNSLPGFYSEPAGVIVIAEFGDAPAGIVCLRPISEQACEIKRLYVKSAARGLGLGALLIDSAVEQARSRGYSRIFLDTLPQMSAAIRLYESRGFTRCAPYYSNPHPGIFYVLALS